MSVNPQLENGYLRISNEIWDEIIRRDFTKRQKDILHLILRLSYGCNKKVAHIPLLQDFSLCGVTPNHITEELKYLKICKVIDWDRNDMMFSFNKNYDIWQMSPVKKWDDERFKELIHMNLTSQNRNFPKQELPEKGSENFPKKEVGEASNPWDSRAEGVSKDSIKDIQEEERPLTALEAYIHSFKKMNYTGQIQGYIQELMKKGYTDAFVREVFLAMGSYGANPDVEYMKKVVDDWSAKGIYTFSEAKRRRDEERQKLAIVKSGGREQVQAPKEYIPDPELLKRVMEANKTCNTATNF